MALPKYAIEASEKLRQILVEGNNAFYERSDELEATLQAVLAQEHTFMLGEPGTGKSLMARWLTAAFDGARYWEILLDRQLPVDSMFGPIDIKEFDATGAWHRKVDGYAPTAHIGFLDEIGKAGPSVTNPLLTWLNERLFHNNSTPMKCNLISAVAASNEELELPAQAALQDRFLVKLKIESIQEPGHFAALLSTAVHAPAPVQRTTLPLDTLLTVVNEVVPAISIPPGVIDSVLQLRSDLRADQITPSDRTWKKSMRLLQAGAFIAGRDTVDDDDLQVLRHVLWDVEQHRKTVNEKVLRLTSPITRAALEFQKKVEDIESGIDERKGQALDKKAKYGGEAKHKTDLMLTEINKTIEKANREGRSTTRLEAVLDQLKAVRVRIYVECLNVAQDRAERMG
jgi:MoxR-like ATPase